MEGSIKVKSLLSVSLVTLMMVSGAAVANPQDEIEQGVEQFVSSQISSLRLDIAAQLDGELKSEASRSIAEMCTELVLITDHSNLTASNSQFGDDE
ncbi:hypothetical protein SAMN04488540_102394 [Ferrimonas sediminum]|uniref:Uncharacterized protein n=1 Tax=Ferrimonas sediminum TaxID=718193 RepID=A0A1G8MKQ0_9GAMM|nr:hypothetical protein [Ferrimonas sediminum]SDI67900.1 hypothetical protein SAMN04488540_102394 [Ferrimonas sediminum]